MAIGYDPQVRIATPEDLADLVRLAARARDDVAAERGGEVFLYRDARPWPVEPSLRSDLEDSGRLVVVGALGTVALGYAVAAVEPTRGPDLAVVSDLYVEPEARGVGLGRQMMDALVSWATEQGCQGIDAVALPGDRATKNFFEGFGLVARKITVHRPLAPPDA